MSHQRFCGLQTGQKVDRQVAAGKCEAGEASSLVWSGKSARISMPQRPLVAGRCRTPKGVRQECREGGLISPIRHTPAWHSQARLLRSVPGIGPSPPPRRWAICPSSVGSPVGRSRHSSALPPLFKRSLLACNRDLRIAANFVSVTSRTYAWISGQRMAERRLAFGMRTENVS